MVYQNSRHSTGLCRGVRREPGLELTAEFFRNISPAVRPRPDPRGGADETPPPRSEQCRRITSVSLFLPVAGSAVAGTGDRSRRLRWRGTRRNLTESE